MISTWKTATVGIAALAAALGGTSMAVAAPVAHAGKPKPGYVTDTLGTHEQGQADAPSGVSIDSCHGSTFGGGFRTSLDNHWTSLAARSDACTGAKAKGSWGEGQMFYVSSETHGQFICRGSMTYGYGTDVWFKTSKGWSWSGGTQDARWNYKKHC